jgi:hypothetical protein
MGAELSSLLIRAAEDLSPTDGLDAGGLSRVVRSVRRRRVRRHTIESVAGVAAAGVLGTAVWAGVRLAPEPHPATPPVSVTPSPGVSSTPTPAPTPSPTPSATSPATPSYPPVPATFGQLSSEPVTDAILASAGEGWTLATYAPIYTLDADVDGAEHDPTTQVLYLVSPQGSRFKVLDLSWNENSSVSQIVHWKAGERRALVTDLNGTYKWLDLRTGRLTDAARPSDDARWLGVVSTGSTIWQASAGTVFSVAPDGTVTTFQDMSQQGLGDVMSPGRTLADLGIPLDLQSGTKRFYYEPQGTQGGCTFAGWLSESKLVLGCTSASGARLLYSTVFSTLDTVQSQPEPTLLFTDPELAAAERVDGLPDGRWLVTGATWHGASGVFVVSGSQVTPLQTTDPASYPYFTTKVVGSTVFVEQLASAAQGTTVTAYDLRKGTTVDVAPMPTDSGDPFGIGPITWVHGLISWTPAAGY